MSSAPRQHAGGASSGVSTRRIGSESAGITQLSAMRRRCANAGSGPSRCSPRPSSCMGSVASARVGWRKSTAKPSSRPVRISSGCSAEVAGVAGQVEQSGWWFRHPASCEASLNRLLVSGPYGSRAWKPAGTIRFHHAGTFVRRSTRTHAGQRQTVRGTERCVKVGVPWCIPRNCVLRVGARRMRSAVLP